MTDLTRTTTALLDGLFDPANSMIWSQFDSRYRPIVIGFARKLGLGDADAADVAQETLTQFVREYRAGKYDRERGRLRSWLIGVAKFRVAAVHRRSAGRREWRGESAMGNLPNDQELTQIWDSERRNSMLREAMSLIRTQTKTSEKTIQAFELLLMQQMPAAAVAEQLNISVQEVYLAKSRVAKRLREILSRLESAYEEDG